MNNTALKKFNSVKSADIEWRNELPFSLEFNDVYFSIHGAIQESTHVFINGNDLLNDWNTNQQNNFKIAELGFGSGLNFLNTAKHWHQHLKNHTSEINAQKQPQLHYIAIEKRPFTLHDFKKVCKLWQELSPYSNALILNYPSQTYGRHQLYFKQWNLTLTLMLMPLNDALDDLITESNYQQSKTKIDHWFLDGFSPCKNTCMWSKNNALNIAKLSKIGTKLATYSVASMVKKPLIEAGFTLTKRKGFAKKREMLTAILKDSENHSQKTQDNRFINLKNEMPWFNSSKSFNNNAAEQPKIAIIGAGIAGCTMAYSLSLRGYCCEIFESQNDIAQAASGAAAGIFHPQLTADMSISSQYSWLGYLSLLRFISSLSKPQKSTIIISQGVSRFLKDNKSITKILQLTEQLKLSHWVKPGEPLANKDNLLFPHSAVIDIASYCRLLLTLIPNELIVLHKNSKILNLHKKDLFWQLNSQNKKYSFNHVIFCGGANNELLKPFHFNGTHVSRGQTCYLTSKTIAKNIKTTLCEKNYLVPIKDNQFHLGATFETMGEPNFNNSELSITSQQNILSQTSQFLNSVCLPPLSQPVINKSTLKGTVGYRLHSQDRLPIVGSMFDQQKLCSQFKRLGQTRLIRKEISHYNLPGLWINTAYGSHGLLYSLIASQHLTSLIDNNISPLSPMLSNAIHPARFLIKDLKSQ